MAWNIKDYECQRNIEGQYRLYGGEKVDFGRGVITISDGTTELPFFTTGSRGSQSS
jgi:hypothetical protein